MILGIDCDGTIVKHVFPEMGEEVPGAFEWLRRFQAAGAKLILWTMRSDGGVRKRQVLTEAVDFCRDRGVTFWGVNTNPEQHEWTGSPKAFCHVFVDDAGVCCPLIYPATGRPYVDWSIVGPEVMRILESR